MPKKEPPKPPPWGIQVFLNEPHEIDKGWIKGTVRAGWQGRPDIELHVADCSRVITLDFDAESLDMFDARIAKVERLRYVVNEFSREALKALKAGKRKAELRAAQEAAKKTLR